MIGDVVRVRFTCTLSDGKVSTLTQRSLKNDITLGLCTTQLVSSTKHSMSRESMEFVLGIDQVVKAFDRALPQMSIGLCSVFLVLRVGSCSRNRLLTSSVQVNALL